MKTYDIWALTYIRAAIRKELRRNVGSKEKQEEALMAMVEKYGLSECRHSLLLDLPGRPHWAV